MRHTIARTLALTLAGAAVAASLLAPDPGVARAQTAAPATPSQVTPSQRVELELWTWALRPWFNEYMADLVAEFEAENPGVRVNWVDVPGEAIVRKYFAAGAAGKLPDVVNLPDKVFLRFANLGGLKSLDGLLPGDAGERYVGPALEQCRVGGRLYGLPWYLSTEISVMNTELLAAGGLTPETVGATWGELLGKARAFREKTGRHLFALRLGEVDLLAQITAEGLEPIVPREDGVGFRSNLGDERIAALLERWVVAFRAGDLPREAATAGYPEVVQSFKEGRVAILNADAVRAVRNDAPRIYESLAVRPGITGAGGKPNVAAVMIAVSPQTKHPELAARLAWKMTSEKWQERLCRQASRVPGTKASLTLPEFSMPEDRSDKLKLALGIGSEQLRMGKARSFIWPTGKWSDMEAAFSEEIKRVLLEGADVRAGLGRIGAKWDAALEQEAEMMRTARRTAGN